MWFRPPQSCCAASLSAIINAFLLSCQSLETPACAAKGKRRRQETVLCLPPLSPLSAPARWQKNGQITDQVMPLSNSITVRDLPVYDLIIYPEPDRVIPRRRERSPSPGPRKACRLPSGWCGWRQCGRQHPYPLRHGRRRRTVRQGTHRRHA